MASQYDLSGAFVECCDCFTICPCWVADTPDEDHCSGLYVWHFAEGSKIGKFNVSGKSVAAATFHGNKAKGQAVLFVDQGLEQGAQAALADAFSAPRENLAGKPGKNPMKAAAPAPREDALADLVKLLGTVIDVRAAKIEADFTKRDNFSVKVSLGATLLASADGKAKAFENKPIAMTLSDTALEDELGIQGAVTVQEMKSLRVADARLPGGPYQFTGRSGMRGQFRYINRISS